MMMTMTMMRTMAMSKNNSKDEFCHFMMHMTAILDDDNYALVIIPDWWWMMDHTWKWSLPFGIVFYAKNQQITENFYVENNLRKFIFHAEGEGSQTDVHVCATSCASWTSFAPPSQKFAKSGPQPGLESPARNQDRKQDENNTHTKCVWARAASQPSRKPYPASSLPPVASHGHWQSTFRAGLLLVAFLTWVWVLAVLVFSRFCLD